MSSTGDSGPTPQARPNNPVYTGPSSNPNINNSRPPLASTIRFGVTATVRATQHQLASPAARGGISLGGGATTGAPQATNNNAGELPQQTQNLFQMRDRLFLALFFRVSLIYARAFPKTLRRVLEFCLFMQSILLLCILGYIHVVYTRTPITCLSEYKDSWPKNGVLRVEITSDAGDDYDLTKSYAKEDRMRQRAAASQFGHYTDDLLSIMLTADSILLDRVVSTASGLISTVTGSGEVAKASAIETTATEDQTIGVVPTSAVEVEPPDSSTTSSIKASSTSTSSMMTSGEGHDSNVNPPEVTSSGVDGSDGSESDGTKKGEDLDTSQNNKSIELEEDSLVAAAEGEERVSPEIEAIAPSIPITASGEGSVGATAGVGITDTLENIDVNNPDSPYFNKTLEEIEGLKMQQKQLEEDKVLNSSVTDYEMFANSVWLQEQAYIVEYALEYGFLRLSPDTRQKLGIPVKLITLDPNKETCFGDTFSLFLLENFLGYDDILMSSIKNLAESEENKGYLRNVVTGEQFRFVPMWMARSSYIPALLIMLVFTVSISMLLRYSHHQIFVFIVDLLNNIEGAGSIHIPAAPLFTVILALVGMEAIMSEFFNDTTTAFYVILIVWIADQYDSVCSHTNITKVYWVRFFYLYHFAFYAYHYRFNGQYGGLALLVSWSFIQHSMVYFYHHYELPAILRQAHQPGHLQNELPNFGRENIGPLIQAPGSGAPPQQNGLGASAPLQQQSQQSPPSNPSSLRSAENISGRGSDITSNSTVINPTVQTSSASVAEANSINNVLHTSITSTSINTSTNQGSSTTVTSPSGHSCVTSTTTRPTVVESQPQQRNEERGLMPSSQNREEDPSLSSRLTSAPTIFNDSNINYNFARDSDRMMRDNGASGVNNNDCNPTRVGLGQSESESATTTNIASNDTFTSGNNTNTNASFSFSPAQISSESHLNLRTGGEEEGDVVQKEKSTSNTSPEPIALNPMANNHSPFERRDEESVSSSSSHHAATTGSSLRHRVPPRQSANGGDGEESPNQPGTIERRGFIGIEEVD